MFEFKLRFCAHMAIMLMLHNRIDPQERFGQNLSATMKYNKIIAKYIDTIATSEILHEPIKLQTIPFYVSMIIGELN